MKAFGLGDWQIIVQFTETGNTGGETGWELADSVDVMWDVSMELTVRSCLHTCA